jgi:hypothetical protein
MKKIGEELTELFQLNETELQGFNTLDVEQRKQILGTYIQNHYCAIRVYVFNYWPAGYPYDAVWVKFKMQKDY